MVVSFTVFTNRLSDTTSLLSQAARPYGSASSYRFPPRRIVPSHPYNPFPFVSITFRYQCAESFSVRTCVSKFTCTSPNRSL